MGTSDVLLLLGLGLHLVLFLARTAATTEVNAVFEDILKVVHLFINGGKGGRQ